METTELKNFLNEKNIVCIPDGFLFTVQSSWIVAGEDRLSYTTLVRIIECCREYHWKTDIQSRHKGLGLDSITKSISGDFYHPILVGYAVKLFYTIERVREKGYSIRFKLVDLSSESTLAEIVLVCIFYDATKNKAIVPSRQVQTYLEEMDILK